MPMLSRRRYIGLKPEATNGTDSVPTNSADAIVVYDLEIHPLSESTSNDRQPFSGNLSQETPVSGLMMGSAKWKTYISGSSAAGTAPPWGRALLGAGFQQTVAAATSVTYTPDSDYNVSSTYSTTATFAGMDTMSMYVWNSDVSGAAAGKLYKLLGAMANVKFMFKVGEIPTVEFEWKGVYAAPTIVSFPAPTFTAHQIPLPARALGCTFTPSGGAAHTAVIRSLEIDMGNEITMRTDGNSTSGVISALIVNRKPTFKMTVEEPASYTPATGQNWWTNFSDQVVGDGTTGLEIGTIGSTAGNIYAITMKKPGFKKVDMSDADGLVTIDIEGVLATSAIATGDDEISIVFT